MDTLFTVGYGAWPASKRLEKLIVSLRGAGVTSLVDVRHSPCSAAMKPGSHYGPKSWNLQASGGIRDALNAAGIQYVWLVELGNPQKNDPNMEVLKAHLADTAAGWPVHHGLSDLAGIVERNPSGCCIMCACDKYDRCHRRLIAEALRSRHFRNALAIENISAKGVIRIE
jgi:uncharacterized protein (DUF488 family)